MSGDMLATYPLKLPDIEMAAGAVVDAITEAETQEDAVSFHGRIVELARLAREIKSKADATLCEYINEHGQVILGKKRWYVGETKTWNPKDPVDVMVSVVEHRGGLEKALEDAGGDEGEALRSIFKYLSDFMGSSAFKHGAVREEVGVEEHNKLFRCEVRLDPKTGVAKKGLKVADEDFMPKPKQEVKDGPDAV